MQDLETLSARFAIRSDLLHTHKVHCKCVAGSYSQGSTCDMRDGCWYVAESGCFTSRTRRMAA
jgi:hypothetical protein